MSLGPVLQIVQGTDRDYPLQVTTDGITPSSAFLAGDVLTGRLWRGGDQPTLFAPAVAWLDAPTAKFQATVSAAQSTGLEVGLYALQCLATRSGRTVPIFDGALEVLAAPGSAASQRTYVGYAADLLPLAAWLDQVEQVKQFEQGFLQQRIAATNRMDWAITMAFTGSTIGQFGSHSQSALSWAGGGPRRSQVPSKVIQDFLAAGYLVLRPALRRVVACWAIGEIGLAHVGRNNVFAATGQYFKDLGDSEAAALTAEIDVNGDGFTEIPVPLGRTNTLFT